MKAPITPDLVYQIKTAGEPSLSPDGSLLAYTLGWVDEESLSSCSKIVVLHMKSGALNESTKGPKDSAAKFSPDGTRLAFMRSVDEGPAQIWVMVLDGSGAKKVTDFKKGVFDYAWSPLGGQLAVCADVDPLEERGHEPGELPQVTVVSRVRYRYDTLGWRGDAHYHIFVVDIESLESRQITDGDWDDTAPVWSPDGSQIAFMTGRRDDRDLLALNEVYTVLATGGDPELVSEGLLSVGALTWSPDGQQLAVVGSDAPEGMVLWQGWLYVLEHGEEPRKLTDDDIKPYLGFPSLMRPASLHWGEDGQIIFLVEKEGESFLYRVSCDGSTCEIIWGGTCLATSLALDGTAGLAVVAASTPVSPGDLYEVDLDIGGYGQLTDYNAEYLTEHPTADMEKFSIRRSGFDVECRLFFPPDFNESLTYPLVLDIHGGPNGAFYDSFVPVQQILATTGYLVLAVNPRGSSTYGTDFMMAVLDDWGGEDYKDLMAAVDLVCQRSYVNSERLGIHGYSYGGYMTSWAIGHTDRFKSAVVGAPCVNLHSMYGTSDIGISFGEPQWGGSIVDAAGTMLLRSPISYAAEVNTPVLLLHGESDARCPIGQSEEYFTILKRLGKEVEFVRFPGCSHLFPRVGHPKMRVEYLARTVDWFNKYLW